MSDQSWSMLIGLAVVISLRLLDWLLPKGYMSRKVRDWSVPKDEPDRDDEKETKP